MKTRISALSVLTLIVASTQAATPLAAAPLGTEFNYQGQLKENGVPIDGPAHLRFSLWDAAGVGSPPVGGIQIGASHLLANVAVVNGLFTVPLNAGGEFGADAFNGEARWIQIEVCADAGCGTLTVLSPRQPLTATPHTLFALNADRLDGLDSSAFLQSIPNPLAIIGTSDSQASIFGQNNSGAFQSTGVFGLAGATTGATNGVRGDTLSPDGFGVFGFNGATSGTTTGVLGVVNAQSGRGVVGWNQAVFGLTTGVYGLVHSANGRAVLGESTSTNAVVQSYGVVGVSNSPATDSAGVRGINNSGGQVIGVEGISTAGIGTGVAGRGAVTGGYFEALATEGETYGGYFKSNSGVGAAVHAENNTEFGNSIYGAANGEWGVGVYGEATGSNGWGVIGYGDRYGVFGELSGSSFNSSGVRGVAHNGQTIGVFGEAYGTSGAGIVGQGETGGYFAAVAPGTNAGWFQGNVNVTGTITKGGGGFKIDHPLDPANKYLLHSFVESPDMKNIYDGNVVTDGQGSAVVTLPDWFEALNKDFRYQLTVIGEFAQAIVAREIERNSFVIRTDKPRIKVSWQVTGIRKDGFAEAHRLPVEEAKEEHFRGYYLHPKAFAMPQSKRISLFDRELPVAKLSAE